MCAYFMWDLSVYVNLLIIMICPTGKLCAWPNFTYEPLVFYISTVSMRSDKFFHIIHFLFLHRFSPFLFFSPGWRIGGGEEEEKKKVWNHFVCFYLTKSYSLAGKRIEAYTFCAQSLADGALRKFRTLKNNDQVRKFL